MQKLLKKLITFESDKNHPHEIKRCFDFVINYLKRSPVKVKTYASNNFPSLIASRKLKKHYQYILCGHLDQVPANYSNSFKPTIKCGRLYGRGASDMKGVIAAMIELIGDCELKNADVALILTTDEEIGGFNGVNYLINKRGYSCECAIVPDGGDNFRLTLAEKGVIHVKFMAKGKEAHGSRPWLGENAIEKLLELYNQIKKDIPDTTPKKRWLPTVNLGRLIGGDAINMVPCKAEIFLDFRYCKNSQRQEILSLIDRLRKKFRGISYKILVDCQISITSSKNKYIKKVISTAKNHKVDLNFTKNHGASDGRFFSVKGIPVIMFKPVCSNSHIRNEWVDLKSLEVYYQILKDFLTS